MKKLLFMMVAVATTALMCVSCSSDDDIQSEQESLAQSMITGKWRGDVFDGLDTYNYGWDFNSDNTGSHYKKVSIYNGSTTQESEEFTYKYDGITLTYKVKGGSTYKRKLTVSGSTIKVYESESSSSAYVTLRKWSN